MQYEKKPQITNNYVPPANVSIDNIINSLNYDFGLSQEDYDQHRFYLPLLLAVLKKLYPNVDIGRDSAIYMNNYPRRGITTKVYGVVSFWFENPSEGERLKYQINQNFNRLMGNKRVYWNYRDVSVYMERGFSYEISKVNAKHVVNEFCNIIKVFSNLVAEAS